MDIVGRFHLADGTEVKVVTGVDDHSRFCVCARVVARATARPVCEAMQWALRTHGVPDQILTDNGKVFTARFGQGPGPVLFDRICANNGIRHLLTAPYSPPRRARSRDSTGPSEGTSWSITTECMPLSKNSSAPSTSGWPNTTRSGHISHWAIDHQSSASHWPQHDPLTLTCQRSPMKPFSLSDPLE